MECGKGDSGCATSVKDRLAILLLDMVVESSNMARYMEAHTPTDEQRQTMVERLDTKLSDWRTRLVDIEVNQ